MRAYYFISNDGEVGIASDPVAEEYGHPDDFISGASRDFPDAEIGGVAIVDGDGIPQFDFTREDGKILAGHWASPGESPLPKGYVWQDGQLIDSDPDPDPIKVMDDVIKPFYQKVHQFAGEAGVSPYPQHWDKETVIKWFMWWHHMSRVEAEKLYEERNV